MRVRMSILYSKNMGKTRTASKNSYCVLFPFSIRLYGAVPRKNLTVSLRPLQGNAVKGNFAT